MELDQSTMAVVVVVGAGAAIASLLVSFLALAGQRRVQRAYRVFARGRRADVLTLLEEHIGQVRALRAEVAELDQRANHLRELLTASVSRVATVRYDAFGDMGGHLSFSAALLDERGDGVVLTTINGRSDTRSYAKPITGGESRYNLSEEEQAAISRALESRRRPSRSKQRAAAPGTEQAAEQARTAR